LTRRPGWLAPAGEGPPLLLDLCYEADPRDQGEFFGLILATPAAIQTSQHGASVLTGPVDLFRSTSMMSIRLGYRKEPRWDHRLIRNAFAPTFIAFRNTCETFD
jgi:hypothetical protein